MRVGIVGGGGRLNAIMMLASAMSVIARDTMPMVMTLRPPPDLSYGNRRWPPFPAGGGGKWRSSYPGKPRPHITPDPKGCGGFTVRVKGVRPRFTKLREYTPPAPNYKGSRYEKERLAHAS